MPRHQDKDRVIAFQKAPAVPLPIVIGEAAKFGHYQFRAVVQLRECGAANLRWNTGCGAVFQISQLDDAVVGDIFAADVGNAVNRIGGIADSS